MKLIQIIHFQIENNMVKKFTDVGIRALCLYDLMVRWRYEWEEAMSIIMSNEIYWV